MTIYQFDYMQSVNFAALKLPSDWNVVPLAAKLAQ